MSMSKMILMLTLSIVFISLRINGEVCNPNAPLPAAYQAMDVPYHLQWARLLNDNIVPGSNLTAYNSTLVDVEWGNYTCDANFVSITDCSGLINALLYKCYFLDLEDRTVVTDYVHAIQNALFGFSWIHNITDVQIGDIFTIRYAPGSEENGHIGIVNALPFKIDPVVPLEPGTDQWAMPLLDQVPDYHYINDSRYAAESVGLGTGLLKVYTYNGTGIIKGYSWSLSPISLYYDYTTNNTIYIGRIDTSLYRVTTGGSSSGSVGPVPSSSSSSASASTGSTGSTTTGSGRDSKSDAAPSMTMSWVVFAIALTAIGLSIPL